MTNPDYNPAIPQTQDSLAESQNPFKINFNDIFNSFLIDHVSLNESGEGNHTVIQLVEQKSGQQTNTSEIALYSKKVTDQTDQVFFRSQQNSQEIQLTNYQLYAIEKDQYFSTLPGGFIVYFGQIPAMGNGKSFTLNPRPKKIIGCGFCPMGNAAFENYAPFIKFRESIKDSGDIDTMDIFSPLPIEDTKAKPQFYIIIGNFI